jgi:hypothetical protein
MLRRPSAIVLHLLGALVLSTSAWAQYEEPAPVPLGDVARSLRKPAPNAQARTIIDNDNFDKVMDDAEAQRITRTSMVYSFDSDGKTFRISPSPDVTCSLSFNAQMTSLISDPYISRDLPPTELAKLDGPASIDSGRLQVSMFNGTTWRVDEIVVSLTILRRESPLASRQVGGRLVPASETVAVAQQKRSDMTVLYKMRAAAAPSATTVFQTWLGQQISTQDEWHWAIVQAKGIPPRGTVIPAAEANTADAGTPASQSATPSAAIPPATRPSEVVTPEPDLPGSAPASSTAAPVTPAPSAPQKTPAPTH